VIDLVTSKLARPFARPGTVRRSSLIERLSGSVQPIVSIEAPPGYGKTTLLSQWAESEAAPFAWVSLDEGDNEPRVLLRYIAEALDGVGSIPDRVYDALSSPRSSVPGSVVPLLGAAFAAMTSPIVLVLDDVHALRNEECRAALSVLADHVPDGSRLALASRSDPPLRVARLRAEGRILDIGPDDLSLTEDEASSLLTAAGVALGGDELRVLHEKTEGWPVGLYLAALSLKEGGPVGSAAVSFRGDERLVSEYVESEFLSLISRTERAFLTRTAVLDRMCGSLCDAVLQQEGSANALLDLERSNLLVMPLDRHEEWYRYHHLFRDMLLGELHRTEPDLIPVLEGRASEWCLRNGFPEAALEYAIDARDVDVVGGLVVMLGISTYRQGRISTLERWLRWLEDHDAAERQPMIAVIASMLFALTGHPVVAERWADAVDRWTTDQARPDDPSTEAWAALARAMLCRRGIRQMQADADEAVQRFATETFVTPTPALLRGIALVLSGDAETGDRSFEDAVGVAEEVDAAEDLAVALCERSLLAIARGDWSSADILVRNARTALPRAHEDGYVTPLVCAVHARLALHHGDLPLVHEELIRAQRLRPELTYAIPHVAVQARNELIRVNLAIGDLAGARTLMREVDEVLGRRPDLGILVGEAEALRSQLSRERGSITVGSSTLTTAEIRLLPMLSTHLTFPEMAEQMFLSPHTVKSQAMSIYRKLGVSSRSQAVDQSRRLGLLDA